MSEFCEFDWRTSVIGHDLYKLHQKHQPVDQNTAIQSLRNLIYQGTDVEVKNNMQQDDKTLLKFLYARKFQVLESYELLKNYYWYRKRNPDVFNSFRLDAPDIHKALSNGLPLVLPSKDRKGRCVVVLNASNWDCSYSLLTIYRALLFTMEHLIEHIHNQANGFVIIVDWTEFTFRQTSYLKPMVLKLMIYGLQDCFPARFKGVHFIGQPWYVEAALTVTKPFLNEKIKERLYVHGNNLSTLHEYVHKDILPTEMGGEQPSLNPKSWLDVLEKEK